MKIETVVDRLLAIKQKKSDLEKEEKTLKKLTGSMVSKKWMRSLFDASQDRKTPLNSAHLTG